MVFGQPQKSLVKVFVEHLQADIFCKCCRIFVNALAFPSQKTLKHLQKVVSAVRIFVNALAFSGLETLKHLQNFVSAVCVL